MVYKHSRVAGPLLAPPFARVVCNNVGHSGVQSNCLRVRAVAVGDDPLSE